MAQPQFVGSSAQVPPPAPGVRVAPPPVCTWRGVALRARERFFVGLAAAATGVAAVWAVISLVASVMLRGSATIPSESTLELLTWQYRSSESAVFSSAEWMTPPLLVVGLLIAAAIVLEGVNQGLAQPMRKAQGKLVTVRWAAGEQRAHARAELRAKGYSGLGGPAAKVRLIVGTVLSAIAGLYGLLMPLQDGFTRGVGPVVVTVASAVTVVAVLAATPWAHWPAVVLFGDGTLTIDGHEPLAEVVAFPTPAVPAESQATPPPPAYPKAAGEPYPPPPPSSGPPPPPPSSSGPRRAF